MKKNIVALSLIFGLFALLPACAADDLVLPNIFIWNVPDETETQTQKNEVKLNLDDDNSTYNAATLKGYTEYRDAVDMVFLKDYKDDFVLNIKKPQKFNHTSLIKNTAVYTPAGFTPGRYSSDEYNIHGSSVNSAAKIGGFSFGTTYNTGIDTSQLERSASMFTRYEYKNFALNTSYRKLVGTTSGNMLDSLFIAPELNLNKVFTIKQVFRSDPVVERTSNEFVLSINPLGHRGSDRLRFEFGAGQTYDRNSELTRTKMRFSTQFRF